MAKPTDNGVRMARAIGKWTAVTVCAIADFILTYHGVYHGSEHTFLIFGILIAIVA